MSNIKPARDLDAEVVQRGNECGSTKEPEDPPNRVMIEAHSLSHLPAAPWCEIFVCKLIFSSFLVLLFGVPRHMSRELS